MQRNASLPEIGSARGHGLAEIKGRDPMDRRVEIEKKEAYARALREQIDMNSGGSAAPSATPSVRSSRGFELGGPGHGDAAGFDMRDYGSPPHCRSSGGSSGAPLLPDKGWDSRGSAIHSSGASGLHDNNWGTADKVARVQDLMRQRMQALQEEQSRQWQRVQAALHDQMGAVREAADQAVQQQMDMMRNAQAADMRAALDSAYAAQRECEAQTRQVHSLSEELASLRQAVERLEAEVNNHRSQLSNHASDIEQLKDAHRECARFRADIKRDICQMQQEQGEAGEAARRLRGDHEELARQVAELSAGLRRLREDVPRLAARAAREALESMRPVSPPPRPPSPPKLDVSEEAYALFRNGDSELHELPGMQNVVGRAPTCDAIINTSQAISNRHASVNFDAEGRASIRDLGSRNGTFLNDKRAPGDASLSLQSGDVVQLGIDGPSYIFEYGPAYFARWPRNLERVDRRARSPAGRMPSADHRSPSPAPAAARKTKSTPFR